jgi:hypothetical protein
VLPATPVLSKESELLENAGRGEEAIAPQRPEQQGPYAPDLWRLIRESRVQCEEPIERWTAKRRVALVVSILKGETSTAEAARQHV